jgi:hypothetical protein
MRADAMGTERGEGWSWKIEAALDLFDFDRCIALRNAAHSGNGPSASSDPALLFSGAASYSQPWRVGM